MRLLFRDVREPERVIISVRTPATVPEREVRLEVRLVRLAMTEERVPERDVTCVLI